MSAARALEYLRGALVKTAAVLTLESPLAVDWRGRPRYRGTTWEVPRPRNWRGGT